MFLNKFLKRKIQKERLDNLTLESTFQEVKKITGITNIKNIVDRVTNKDKDYNNCVAKVSQRETKINILKDKIAKLDRDFTELKNSASIDPSESKTTARSQNFDQTSQDLLKKEEKLREDLEDMRDKSINVELIYDKVVENLKLMTKFQDDHTTQDASKSAKTHNAEEELILYYREFLIKMNNIAISTYDKVCFNLSVDVEE